MVLFLCVWPHHHGDEGSFVVCGKRKSQGIVDLSLASVFLAPHDFSQLLALHQIRDQLQRTNHVVTFSI